MAAPCIQDLDKNPQDVERFLRCFHFLQEIKTNSKILANYFDLGYIVTIAG